MMPIGMVLGGIIYSQVQIYRLRSDLLHRVEEAAAEVRAIQQRIALYRGAVEFLNIKKNCEHAIQLHFEHLDTDGRPTALRRGE
jgi:DUF971 family protein